MKIKSQVVFFLFMGMFFHVYAKKDTTKIRYVHSYISFNAGYQKNMSSPQSFNNPDGSLWWTKGGPEINVSGYLALKESYFGIAMMAGYNKAAFITSAYESTIADSDKYMSYKGGNAGNYSELCFMAGLGLKIPGYTTPYAFELRVMAGPLICTLPSITYNTTYQSFPNPEPITTNVKSSTALAYALDAGIGYGYKISQHWGFMGYCDLMFSSFFFKTSNTNIYPNGNTTENISIRTEINSLSFSGGLVYTFGKMTGNFVY